MRILFLTSEFPYPPYAGAPLRNFGLIEGLAGQDHDIWLLSFGGLLQLNNQDTPLHTLCNRVQTVARPLRSISDRLKTLLLTPHADIARRFYDAAYEQKLRQWLSAERFDVIQIENLEMAAYLPLIKQLQPETPVIYDAHNAEYALQQRIYETERGNPTHALGVLYSLIQARRIRALEEDVCRAVDHVLAVSEADADLLRRLNFDTPVTVLSNGISSRLYETASEPIELQAPALVFTGKMDYRPNIDAALWFAEEVLPLVRESLPEAHFYVVGQSPHARLAVLRGQPGITLTGLVPEIIPYLHAATVFVVPLRMGSGTRLKVLEAMASGCAIVSTRIGAQGITVTDGQELLLADTVKEFAKAVVRLTQEPDKAAAMGANARRFVRENYDWDVLLPTLFTVYEELSVG